jgi:hypothetical protein
VRDELGVVVKTYTDEYPDTWTTPEWRTRSIEFRASCLADLWRRRELEIYVATGGVACHACGLSAGNEARKFVRHIDDSYVSDKGEYVPAKAVYTCGPCEMRDRRFAHIDRWGADG